VIIFIYILNSLTISFTRVVTKELMELKYISHYRIIFFIGVSGFILTFFLLIISSNFFPSEGNEKYLSAKPLNNTSIFSFSILSFIYKFPFLSPLRNCNIQTPKYIKHFIVTLALSYGVIISLILFLLYYPFKEKQDIIDKRDIKNPDYEIIDSHIIFKYFNTGIVFSFFGLMISILFVYIFGIILSYNNDELKYWKNMKSLPDNYICNDIKKEVLLGSFWKKIKLRMLAYCNICGNYT
jgi:hypothetical protein